MPEVFGRYELHDLLGRGGMGEVYRAVDTVRDRTVALKLLPRHLAGDDSFQTRFRRESRMAARLNDPHIIPIHDFGEIDGQLFIDMRLVEGRDLGSVLAEQGALPVSTAVTIASQVAGALEAAHRAGLVHRDVKPSNVLLSGWTPGEDFEPFAYLVDFGIARSANQEGTALTATSGTVGTVAYMSPERIGGQPGDRRTDIYALGCVLYETITGRKPFDGEMFAIMYAHMNTPPPRITDLVPDAPRALDDVIARALAKDPDQRFATADEFALAARQAIKAPGASTTSTAWFGATPSPTGGPSSPQSGPVGAPPSGLTPYAPRYTPTGSPPAAPPPGHPSAPVPQYPAPPYAGEAPAARSAAYPAQQPAAPYSPPRTLSAPGPTSGEHPRAPYAAAPRTAGTPTGGPTGAPPPGPTSTHPSGPLPPGRPPTTTGGGSKRNLLLAIGALVVVAAVVLAVALSGGSSNSPAAGRSSAPTTSGGRSSSNSPPPASYKTGDASTPAVSWQHFGSFTHLLGTSNGDSAHAFLDGNCALAPRQSSEPSALVDEVACTYPTSTVTSEVARFRDAASLRTLFDSLITDHSYALSAIRIGERTVGLRAESPASGKDVDIITYLCGLPAYAVQFYAADKTKPGAGAAQVESDFWQSSEFPDVLPGECNDSFTGPKAGSQPTTAGAAAAKQLTTLTSSVAGDIVDPQHLGPSHVATATIASGSEIAVVGTTGTVAFWKYDKDAHTLQLTATRGYPYKQGTLDTSNLTVTAKVLAGMTHATFIVRGTFSTDGTGNAVAYTYDVPKKTWGAIKAETRTSLKVTDEGVGPGGIGLSQNFAFVNGRLETDDCSSTVPASQCGPKTLVTKYWEWDGTHFILFDTAGLPN